MIVFASRKVFRINCIFLPLYFAASLDPPDYDPALYDFHQVDETDPDDIEWKNWLNGLFQGL